MLSFQPDAKDVQFACARCSASRLSWLQEAGRWRCSYHPGTIEVFDAGVRSWRRYSCCYHSVDFAEMWPLQALRGDLSVSEAVRGCTPCDHAADYEDIDTPIVALREALAPQYPPLAHSAPAVLPGAVARVADILKYSDVYWSLYASPVEKAKWTAAVGALHTTSPHVLAIHSWLPRQQSIYDSPEENEKIAASSDNAYQRDVAVRFLRLRTQRVALGVRADGSSGTLEEARAGYYDPANLSVPLVAVPRHGKFPTDSERAAVAERTTRLFHYSDDSAIEGGGGH